MALKGWGAGLLAALASSLACYPDSPSASGPPPSVAATRPLAEARLRPRILAEWPHDPTAFTQGLVFDRGRLIESLGLYQHSEIRIVEFETGEVLRRRSLPASWFGEGLAASPRGWVQLTWREGVAAVWGPEDLSARGQHEYEGEGWGLAFDGHRLIQSDGTHRLTFRDPSSFSIVGTLEVIGKAGPMTRLNELEWVGSGRFAGLLFANIWLEDRLVGIDPATGRVRLEIDASNLIPAEERGRYDVMNGIAFDGERDVFYLTGKHWPWVFEVDFEDQEQAPAKR